MVLMGIGRYLNGINIFPEKSISKSFSFLKGIKIFTLSGIL